MTTNTIITNENLRTMTRKAHNLIDSSDPQIVEYVVRRVLSNNDIGVDDFLDTVNAEGLDINQRSLERQIENYRNLKRLLLRTFEQGDFFFDFNPGTIQRTISGFNEILGRNMGDYIGKLPMYLISYEIVKEFENAPRSQAEILNDRGYDFLEEDRYNEAISHFDEAIALSPRFPLAYINKGIAFRKMRRYDEAIGWYDRIIEFRPGYKKAYYNKAVALFLKGDIPASKEAIDKALELDPSYPLALELKMQIDSA